MPPLCQAGERAVELCDEASPDQDRRGEDEGHGDVGHDAPREIVLTATRGRREDDADRNTEQTGHRLLEPLPLDEADDAGEERDARRSDQRRDKRTGGHVDENEHEAGCGCFDDAARTSERVGPREVVGGCLAHPARCRHQPSPAMTR